ncbi:hypothetical protein ACFY7H_13295 [Streptomyces sp. NPDC012794]|uniref:hypothetical protein n=1 Tax=Streptomyces sp. NPDC012794 TaxID=3364850 RepID=UPI0036A858AA
MTAPTPPIARLDADLQMLALKRAADERMRRLMVAEQQYDVDHLDIDSQASLPGSYPVSYLRLGGQS